MAIVKLTKNVSWGGESDSQLPGSWHTGEIDSLAASLPLDSLVKVSWKLEGEGLLGEGGSRHNRKGG